MALQITKSYPDSKELSYWRIHRINCIVDGEGECLLAGYKDKTWRLNDVEGYGDIVSIPVTVSKDSFVTGTAIEECYTQVTKSKLSNGRVETNPWATAVSV